MDSNLHYHINEVISRYPSLKCCKLDIEKAYMIMEESFSTGKKLLVCGNGGSAADSDHIVGELMKGFKLPRKCPEVFIKQLKNIDTVRGECLAEKLQGALPAIALHNHAALNTAYCNDVDDGSLYVYAQQVFGYGQVGDVFLGISTSGNAVNVINAAVTAKAIGMKVIALVGKTGGELASFADVAIKVPETETYLIQELHLPIYHTLCLMLEEVFLIKI